MACLDCNCKEDCCKETVCCKTTYKRVCCNLACSYKEECNCKEDCCRKLVAAKIVATAEENAVKHPETGKKTANTIRTVVKKLAAAQKPAQELVVRRHAVALNPATVKKHAAWILAAAKMLATAKKSAVRNPLAAMKNVFARITVVKKPAAKKNYLQRCLL